MSPTADDLLARARSMIIRVSPQEPPAAVVEGALLVDIRPESQAAGTRGIA